MDSNRETILDELNDFDKKRPSDISTILENYLGRIAKTGDPMFPWNKLKPLIQRKMEIVIAEFHEGCPTDALPPLPNVDLFKYDDLRCKILEAVDSFPNAPFTIQRLCELLTSPKKHYKRTDKFMRGLEKNILVVSTVEPRSTDHSEVNNNNNLIMNGIIESSAVADMLSTENVNLTSHSAVINGTPSLSDSYHTGFSQNHTSSIMDAAADSESSSSSDSDSSSDSLPPDYVKDSQMDSMVDSTSALHVESAMDTSQDILDGNESEENVSSSNELRVEKELLVEDGMSSEDIGSLVADSTASQSCIVKRDDNVDEGSKEIPESSECDVETFSIPDEKEMIVLAKEAEEEEESTSEVAGRESPTKMLLIEEVSVSLSQVLDATHQETLPSDCCATESECISEHDTQPQEEAKGIEVEMACESQTNHTEEKPKCDPDKMEPMEED